MNTPLSFVSGSVVKVVLGEPFAAELEPQFAIALQPCSGSPEEALNLMPFLLIAEGIASLTVYRTPEAVTEVLGQLSVLPDGSGVTTKPLVTKIKPVACDDFDEPFTDVRGDEREEDIDEYDELSVKERDALRRERFGDIL